LSNVRIEAVSRDKRHRYSDAFDARILSLLPAAQRALLNEWLKGSAQTRRWDSLLRLAGAGRIEIAESLALTLAECGAATLEERFERGVWLIVSLAWHDYEALCASLGLTTRSVSRDAFSIAWNAAADLEWHSAALFDACQALRDAPPDKGRPRLALLEKLNAWLHDGRSGTRREFALFARGQTKQISGAEWAWLETCIELADCGIERHAPALWLAGELRLQIRERWLDVGAAGDFVALTPATLHRLNSIETRASHYRLIENRTSFENVARNGSAKAEEIVIWLPGYAPAWWRAAVGKLLDTLPLPARISCDADPDGVQIALNAGELWGVRDLSWEPCAMRADDAAASRNKLSLTERDARLAQSLLDSVALPPSLDALLRWCLANRSKAEQENWL
jgi:hypothetical protein